MEENEIWKNVFEYGGFYQVSNTGKVRSKNKVLKSWIDKGYVRVGLSKHSKKKFFTIHRLVAIHFILNPKKLPEVNHKDGNKENNSVENLEWTTQLENNNHARNILKTPGGHFTEVLDLSTGVFYNSIRESHLAKNYKHPIGSTVAMLDGRMKNKTTLIKI